MLPAIIGGATAAASLYGLISELAKAGREVSPEELAGEVERRAMAVTQQSGLPLESAKAAVLESTKADLEKANDVDGLSILFSAIGLLPGVGLARWALAGAKSGAGAMAGLKAADDRIFLAKGPVNAASINKTYTPKAPAAPGGSAAAATETPMDMSAEAVARRARNTPFDEQAAEYVTPSVDEMLGAPVAKAKRAPRKAPAGVRLPAAKAGEEAAEVANPARRAAHGAEEAGEYTAADAVAALNKPMGSVDDEVAAFEKALAGAPAAQPKAMSSDDLVEAAMAARGGKVVGGRSTSAARQAFMEALTK